MTSTINSWNGKFTFIINKKTFRVLKNGTEIIREKIREDKTPQEIIKERIPPDIYQFGKFKIKYYAWMVDNNDFEKAREYINMYSKQKGIGATLAISSIDNIPIIMTVWRSDKIYLKNFTQLEDFEEFFFNMKGE